jgi:hypothetical protein
MESGGAGVGPSGENQSPGGKSQSPGGKRPLLERLGMGAIAGVLALLFGGIAVASWAGGEGFLALMAAIGALMTLWAGVMTVLRG